MPLTHSQAQPGKRRADGSVIKELRLERELRITAAARLIGCHPKTLDHIERGKRGASEVMVRKIARAFGVKPDELRSQDVAA